MTIINLWRLGSCIGYMSLIGLIACSSDSPSQNTPPAVEAISLPIVADSEVYQIPYDLAHADETITLPGELVEVSGLSYLDSGQLALVQDERGVIYLLDIESQSIQSEYKFGKSGDYEGIEVVNGVAYVMKSNGKIYEVANFLSDSPQIAIEYNNHLKGDDDTEGLGYDPVNQQLLIACKEPHHIGEREFKERRAVYAYDIKTHLLGEQAAFTVNTREIAAFLSAYGPKEEWAMSFDPSKKGCFKPSGIAVHPQTGYIYMIASVGRLMLILNPSYQIIAIAHLNKELFDQPEGICFSKDGDLYISNEGRSGYAKVLKFSSKTSP